MPPAERIEDYLELVAAVETAAAKAGLPVHIEGYPPPVDPRLNVIRVAPDPGVIEVNIHPAPTGTNASRPTEAIYEEARLARLGADKFMIDGKHSGHRRRQSCRGRRRDAARQPVPAPPGSAQEPHHPTGSGVRASPISSPACSSARPARRRASTRRATTVSTSSRSRSPRSRVPARAPRRRPWLLDRLMRNLLTDVTGNTHRAEICIDKLYSPDGPTGRLGLSSSAASRCRRTRA